MHKKNWVDTHTLACTNHIEGTWDGIKSNIKPRGIELLKFKIIRQNLFGVDTITTNLWDFF